MNKLLKLSIMGVLSLGLFACGNKTTTAAPTTTNTPTTTAPAPKETIKLLTPAGTPLMAIAGIIGSEGVNVESVNGPENLIAGLSKKSHDLIIAPLTAGAKLSIAGKTSYKLEAVLTINNTYIISKGSTTLTNIPDLKGKNVIAYGQNQTADIALKNALKKANIETSEVDITYENDVATATSTFMGGSDYDYCLSAEPQITNLKVKKGANLKTLDLKDYMTNTVYQAGIFVNPDANQTRCNEVIEDIKNNVTYLNGNASEYAAKVVDKNAFLTNLGIEALAACIPNANLVFIKAKDNKDTINAYFTELNTANPNILGGMVTDEFYR